MKTKEKSPWNVKAGDTVLVHLFPDTPPRQVVITRVSKGRGTFTGSTVWRHFFKHPLTGTDDWILSHGIRRSHHRMIASWPAEKITVVIPDKVPA